MDVNTESKVRGTNNSTSVERTSDRELVITRVFNGPARLVFEAWTRPELMQRWWMPKSCGAAFVSCDMDVRTGGSYRFVFSAPSSDQTMAFFGKYIDVVPNARLVWSNEEGGEAGPVTTVTFTEKDGRTTVVMSDLHPTKESLDAAIESGSTSMFDESFGQLDEVLAG